MPEQVIQPYGKRESYIDLLKCIGFLGMIIAHSDPPEWVFFLRSFDLPLLVIVSGMLTRKSSNISYKDYVLKRFRRLVLPTWLFLVIYYLLFHNFGGGISRKQILMSFTLLGRYDIGYVWIIGVYMVCACSMPILNKLTTAKGAVILCGVYFLYELCLYWGVRTKAPIIYVVLYYYPYIFMTYYGMMIKDKLTSKQACSVAALMLTIFLCIAAHSYVRDGYIPSPQTAKYPVRIYYMSYGIGIATILILMFRGSTIQSKFMFFLSTHSLWLYFWHIPFITISAQTGFFREHWMLRAIFVLAGSCIITILQSKIVRIIEDKYHATWTSILKG